MAPFTRRTRIAKSSRLLVVVLLVGLLLAGTGVAAADVQVGTAGHCPGENPERGTEHAEETGEERSLQGRVTALASSNCL